MHEDEIISIEARSLPTPLGSYMQMAVLKKMHGVSYTCYTGAIPDTSMTNPNYLKQGAMWIMLHGNKLSFDEAQLWFSNRLDEVRYYK